MKERREARGVALGVLYEADIKEMLPLEAFEMHRAQGFVSPAQDDPRTSTAPAQPEPVVLDYSLALLQGVQEHQTPIDMLISKYADRWALTRMPVTDRAILRIAIFEILWGEDVPVAVAINEAVELAKSLSTEDSGRFINGLLGRIAEQDGPRGEE